MTEKAAAMESEVPIAGSRVIAVLPPVLALFYPWAIWCLFESVTLVRTVGPTAAFLPLLAVGASLALCGLPSAASVILVPRLAPAARGVAYLAFATPALYTVARVLVKAFDLSIDDRLPWAMVWAALALAAANGRGKAAPATGAGGARLRLAHGVSAAVILVAFLIAHIVNHLLGLASVRAHVEAMDLLRHWYRAPVIEVLVVAAFLFQIGTGARLAAMRPIRKVDGFRALQVATGVGLTAFLFAHLVAVFIIGRLIFNVDTDWSFATSFKPGLLGNLANARQVPYYWFAIFATASHLACGLRIVLLAHGWPVQRADRLTVTLIFLGAVLATLILIGMCGIHVIARG